MSTDVFDVAVIGAGIAGLITASQLQQHGMRVIVLEARERIGGRIHSELRHGTVAELGAEMIHGKEVATWDLVRRHNLSTFEGPQAEHFVVQGELHTDGSPFAKEVQLVLQALSTRYGEDVPLGSALASLAEAGHNRAALTMAKRMLVGLEGADQELSLDGLQWRDEKSSFLPQNFCVAEGYQTLCHHLASSLNVMLQTEIRSIEWGSAGRCTAVASDGRRWIAKRVVVTVPLGVLKSGLISFQPQLPLPTQSAIHTLGMGKAVKCALWFRTRCWKLTGFIETDGAIGSWWPRADQPLISSLTGGEPAALLCSLNDTQRRELALGELEIALGPEVRSQIVDFMFVDWINDPYSRGGYSFNHPGINNSRRVLATPIERTLFLAGEACCYDGDYATVHGAIESAYRCVNEVLTATRESPPTI